MHTVLKAGKTIRILVVGLIFWMLPGMALQANDDYLSLLEAEAGDTGETVSQSIAPVSTRQAEKVQSANKRDVIQAGLDFEDFEAELDSHYSGSHFLYAKLSNSNRRKVYQSYREDNRISVVREEIVRLLSSS